MASARLASGRRWSVNSNNDLTYLLAWESLAEREKRWGAFMSDPEWIAARSDSEKDGQIVANISSSFLQPTGVFQRSASQATDITSGSTLRVTPTAKRRSR